MIFHCVLSRVLRLWVSTTKETREEIIQEIQEIIQYGANVEGMGGYETELRSAFPPIIQLQVERDGSFVGTVSIHHNGGTNYCEWLD